MKVVIIDEQRLTQIRLPEKVDGVFLTNYKYPNTRFERVINIEAENNNWVLKSNGSVDVSSNNAILDKMILKDYNYFNLSVTGTPYKIGCYSYPSNEKNKIKLQVVDPKNGTQIKIGSNSDCDLCYKSNLVADLYATIDNREGQWFIRAENDKCFVYLNSHRVKDEKLKIGDIIFIFGLKIVWMEKFVQINNPSNSVNIKSMALANYLDGDDENNNDYAPVSEEEQNLQLYKESDYFFHNPRLIQSIENQEVIIDDPPDNQLVEDIPFIFSIGTSLTMVASSFTSMYTVYSGISSGTRTIASSIPSIVMCVALVIGSLLMPRLAKAYTKRKQKEREKLRQVKYSEYVAKKEQEIKTIIYKQGQILKENYRHVSECKNLINGNKRLIWNRMITDDDFLKVRLGLGNAKASINITAPEDRFTLDEDNLRQMVFDVVANNQMIEEVPITFSFLEDRISAVICESSYEDTYINSLILQLITYQSAMDLKIVFLLNGPDKARFEYAKFMPHCFSEDKSVRYFATTIEEMKNVSNALEEEFTKRKATAAGSDKQTSGEDKNAENRDEPYKNFGTYYLVITDDFMAAKNIAIVDNIINSKLNFGFSLLILDHSMQKLPSNCNSFINIINSEGAIIHRDLNSQSVFKPEYDSESDMRDLCTTLLNIPTITAEALKALPTSLSFLEMYNVSKIEQLNVLNRWKTNDPTISLQAPVGVHTNGELFYLDLHEKFHGPHGLIAGSTGSGKSEFIITYILSMAVNYHPDEVQFVLIDYKGGGLAGAFENREQGIKIPHLAGTITNLDTSEMNRTLVSINSELKRRQRIFNETRDMLGESTIDIYKYQKYFREGVVKEAIPHLFIISDEFAELKSQQPEFMDELISTARIGRSLGVHLILATQKPSGVVNEQIWSNSKFKVCLKVQSTADSNEMLKKPDAASIKETGRFYLQVGYDEYFDIGQSGWGGAKYIPTDRVIKKVDDSINFVNNVGYIIKSASDLIKKEVAEEKGDQLTNTVRHLVDIGVRENLREHPLWLDKIPDEIFIDNLKEKYSYTPTPYSLNPIIGEYDNPVGQKQGLLTLDLTKNGNTIIWGMNGSGKENFLHTMLYSLTTNHTPDEVNIYLVDMGAETLKVFSRYPQVGDICFIDDNEKIFNLLIMLDDEMDRRKGLFNDYNGNIANYNAASGKKEKYIIVVINNYEGFLEASNKLGETIIPFYREGNKYGIIFVCTLNTTGSIRSKAQEYFKNKIMLQMANATDYRTLLNAPKTLTPSKSFGRGLVMMDDGTYEFQTAYICKPDRLNEVIKSTGNNLAESYINKAKRIPSIPEVVTTSILANDLKTLNDVPIGIDIETRYSLCFDFMKGNTTTMLANDINTMTSFIYGFLELFRMLPNASMRIIDVASLINIDKVGIEFEYFNGNFEQAIVKLVNDMNNDANLTNPVFYLILGLGGLKDSLNENFKKTYDSIFNNLNRMKNTKFIFVDSYNAFKKNVQTELWFRNNIEVDNGIWFGEGVDQQLALSFDNLTIEDKKMVFADMAFVTNKNSRNVMKSLTNKDGDK